ncbi:unnamed protein product [Heterobilharzia americana]|nr:unnamed protein product [Heterobilharzia americana]
MSLVSKKVIRKEKFGRHLNETKRSVSEVNVTVVLFYCPKIYCTESGFKIYRLKSATCSRLCTFSALLSYSVQNKIRLTSKQLIGMESDDSYETASVNLKADTESDFSDNQTSDHSSLQYFREANDSSYDGYLSNTEGTTDACANNKTHSFAQKCKEQGKKIKRLEQERIGFLEQIADLCSLLEKKQQELVEVLQLSEEKAKYHAHYMTEVSSLLAELGTLFPETSSGCNAENKASKNHLEVYNKREQSNSNESKNTNLSSTNSSVNGNCTFELPRDHHGRTLLNALSAAVNAAKNMYNRRPSKNNSEILQISALPSESINDTGYPSTTITTNKLPHQFMQSTESTKNSIASEVRILPSFCWSADHVLYWLREYVCLPGGCLEAASQLRMDGKQLTTIIDKKVEKLLHLNDEGLRRKFFSALEDLRIHGPPGLSRHPGASHINYHWICDVWLKHHLGLVHLIHLFSVRRIDGRMLSSLIRYKREKRPRHYKHRHSSHKRKSKHNNDVSDDNSTDDHDIIISNPTDDIPLENYSEQNLINLKTNKVINHNDTPVNGRINNSIVQTCDNHKTDSSIEQSTTTRNWHVAGRKEMLHILLGQPSNISSSSNSGGDLSTDCKYLLGKKEVESLRAAIELLHQHHFNVESIEKIRTKTDPIELDLLYWTNDHISKWLCDLGLKDFTHGIEATGLHGAYMVLDTSFDIDTLIKRLRIPVNIATTHKLNEHLQRVLKPARHKIFRRRSVSRPNCSVNTMQRSMTSNSAINGSYLSLTHSSSNDVSCHSTVTGNLMNANHDNNNNNNKILTSPSSPPSLPVYLPNCTKTNNIHETESLNLVSKNIDLTSNNPIGLTPKREKRRVFNVTTDIMGSNRLTRVFTRNHKTSRTTIDQSSNNPSGIQILRQMSITGLNSNDNSNNTNSSNNNLDWLSDVEDKSNTLVRKQSDKGLFNPSTSKSLQDNDSSNHKKKNKSTKVQSGISTKSIPLNHNDSNNSSTNNTEYKKTTLYRQAVQVS